VSRFSVFGYDGKCLGSGKSEEEAYEKACETLAAAGLSNDRVFARMVEYIRGDQDSHQVVLYPQWNGSHPTGQS
jgi:hypothetical protein